MPARPLRRLTARLADRLPAPAVQRLLVARSAVTSRPTISLPVAERALVLAPHPDDETLVCGGTAARLRDAGTQVRVVVVTDGRASQVDLSPTELGRRRRDEATAACEALGLDPPIFHGFPDGSLCERVRDLTDEVRHHLDGFTPEVVLLPWFGDEHPDHRAVNLALRDAIGTHEVEIWGGEAWTPAPITRLVDITDAVGRKRAAMGLHATAAAAFDLEAMLSLNRYRSVHGLRGHGYAEGFVAAPADTYLAWMRTMEAS